jgi:hypothetical protein
MRRSADFVFGIYQFVVLLKRAANLNELARMSTAKGAHRRFTLAAFGSSLVMTGGVGRIAAME